MPTYIAQPAIGPEEKQAVMDVLDSGLLAQGARVKAFEEDFAEFCGVSYAIATSSGSTALHTALLSAGLGPGDEVITSPFSFIASANTILYCGARPVFADIDPLTFNLDPKSVEAAITPSTKAIMPVHLFGLCCDMDAMQRIAMKYNLLLLEDACQSHGATFREQKAGTFGIGSFSFYPTKNITSGEGGMITTADEETAEKCRLIRSHGMSERYHHDSLGYNFRMTDLHAAIGVTQLKKIGEFTQARRRNAALYNELLDHLPINLPVEPEGYQHVYHQYTIRIPGGLRNAAMDALTKEEIYPAIYYPIPIHQQAYYVNDLGYQTRCPQAEAAADEVLSLPIHPGVSVEEIQKITRILERFSIDNNL